MTYIQSDYDIYHGPNTHSRRRLKLCWICKRKTKRKRRKMSVQTPLGRRRKLFQIFVHVWWWIQGEREIGGGKHVEIESTGVVAGRQEGQTSFLMICCPKICAFCSFSSSTCLPGPGIVLYMAMEDKRIIESWQFIHGFLHELPESDGEDHDYDAMFSQFRSTWMAVRQVVVVRCFGCN